MRRRIFFKLLAVFALVIASVTVTLNFSVRKAWQDSLFNEIQRSLQQKTLLFANRVNSDRSHSLQDIVSQEGQASGARATVIDTTGNVLADSQADASKMENPAGQPEFAQALRGRVGTSSRRSATIGVPFLYVAAPIPGGAVRLAYPLSDLEAETSPIRRTLLTSSAWACLVALLVAAVVAQIISRRLNRIVQFADKVASGDLTARIASRWDDEIGQVAGALDQTARHLEANFLALQTSQHQLETLLNSMQDAVIAVGSDERVQWANQSMDRLVSKPARLNVPVVETVRDPDFLRAVRTASQTGKVVNARATSVLPARAYDVTAAPLPGGGAVAVLRDLTENERVEKTRRDFIANVSHELRTPLTSIQGYTETLLDSSPANNHVREFLEIIRKNAARMSRLTEDLLTLARVESGEQRFDFQTVLPAELLGEALESFAGVARAQGVQLEVENQTTTAVLADAEAIHQVFSNLIENALKYAASSPRIVLGARQKERQVEFFVRDLGPGIPSEHVPRLFERFYRVDKARSRESGGTGLGLAIAKHIMLAHGGTIRAESELNHGATFLFLLPAAQVTEPAEVEANSAG